MTSSLVHHPPCNGFLLKLCLNARLLGLYVSNKVPNVIQGLRPSCPSKYPAADVESKIPGFSGIAIDGRSSFSSAHCAISVYGNRLATTIRSKTRVAIQPKRGRTTAVHKADTRAHHLFCPAPSAPFLFLGCKVSRELALTGFLR